MVQRTAFSVFGVDVVITGRLAFVAALAVLAPLSVTMVDDGEESLVAAWGLNAHGQTDVPALGAGVQAVAGGRYHSLAVTEDRRVVGWGDNGWGQIEVPAAAQSVSVDVSGGIYHSLALTGDGRVLAWGDNRFGQLDVPAQVQGRTVSIAASGVGSIALTEDGSVSAWGGLASGLPGGLDSGVRAIAGGDFAGFALTQSGSVVAWTSEGQVDVPERARRGVRAIAAGASHAVALTEEGEVFAWGENGRGQADVPAAALSGVAAIASSGHGSLALLETGEVVAWGDERYGQLDVPTGLNSGIAGVARGALHSLVLQRSVERIAGADRFETAAAVSREAHPVGTVPVVFLANGMNFPDSLSAGPAAASMGAPVLLTAPDRLPEATAKEIARLQPETVVIVGGPAAVSESVASAVKSTVQITLRVWGKDRFETSRELAAFAFEDAGAGSAFVASGANFADALAAGAAIGSRGPVLLVDGESATLDAGAAGLLQGLGVQKVWVAGGPASVSEGVRGDLERLGVEGERLAGADRYETSRAISREFGWSQRSHRVFLSSGVTFPDALVGSTLAARDGAPLVLTSPGCVLPGVLDDARRAQASVFTLLGGTSALSGAVEQLERCGT